MTVRMIALDLDGTTLNSENRLTERTKDALIKATAKGVKIVPVTGRCYKSLPKELIKINDGKCIRYAVTSNGAEIRDAQTGEIIYSNYIDPLGVEEIKKALCKIDAMVEVYVKGSAYIERSYYEKVEKEQIHYRSRDYVLTTRIPVKGVKQLLDVHKDKIEKVAIYFEPDSAHYGMTEALEAVSNAHITSSGSNNIELIAKNCSKAKTLEVLCNTLDISMSDIMAVGDSQNDIEMLGVSGISIAMGNAEENVKRCADHITSSNDHDGVAEAIDREIFNNM